MQHDAGMRAGAPGAGGVICGALLGCLAISAMSRPAAAEGTGARAVIERAGRAMHVERLVSHGGLVIDAQGTRDLATLRQGMQSVQPERSPLATRLAVDLPHRTVAFETNGRINADADEHLRYVFRAGADTLLVDFLNSRAFGIGPDEQGQAGRYLATVPHLLIHALLAPPAEAPALSKVAGEPSTDAVAIAAQWPDGRALTLLLDRATHYVLAVRTTVDLPVDGPVALTWTYEAYAEVDGVPFPGGHTVSWGGKTYEALQYRRIALHAPEPPEFSTPPGIAAPPPPAPSPAQSSASSGPPPSPLLEVRPGIYLFRHARGGFHPLVVAQSDGLLVVDAPAPWHELSELPPSRSEPGVDSGAVGARLLAALGKHLPDKPVRRLVLTHEHGDHMGGALPFLDAGIEVVAAPATRDALAAMLRSRGRDVAAASIHVVEGRLRVDDATRPVELIDVGPNPHADGMLVAYLPNERLLYQSDLFEPLSPANFPSRPRLPTAQWFTRWLDGSTLAVDEVFAIHGSARVTAEQLDGVRASQALELEPRLQRGDLPQL
jgi:glyoxylase-like metal-dependent hydrolase (beta-lactamase superfamily II)